MFWTRSVLYFWTNFVLLPLKTRTFIVRSRRVKFILQPEEEPSRTGATAAGTTTTAASTSTSTDQPQQQHRQTRDTEAAGRAHPQHGGPLWLCATETARSVRRGQPAHPVPAQPRSGGWRGPPVNDGLCAPRRGKLDGLGGYRRFGSARLGRNVAALRLLQRCRNMLSSSAEATGRVRQVFHAGRNIYPRKRWSWSCLRVRGTAARRFAPNTAWVLA